MNPAVVGVQHEQVCLWRHPCDPAAYSRLCVQCVPRHQLSLKQWLVQQVKDAISCIQHLTCAVVCLELNNCG